jgi:hypothetical protein
MWYSRLLEYKGFWRLVIEIMWHSRILEIKGFGDQ